jgi:hypothetical protein
MLRKIPARGVGDRGVSARRTRSGPVRSEFVSGTRAAAATENPGRTHRTRRRSDVRRDSRLRSSDAAGAGPNHESAGQAPALRREALHVRLPSKTRAFSLGSCGHRAPVVRADLLERPVPDPADSAAFTVIPAVPRSIWCACGALGGHECRTLEHRTQSRSCCPIDRECGVIRVEPTPGCRRMSAVAWPGIRGCPRSPYATPENQDITR